MAPELAKKQLQRLATSLQSRHPGAAACLREELEETLTVQTLGTRALYRTAHLIARPDTLGVAGSSPVYSAKSVNDIPSLRGGCLRFYSKLGNKDNTWLVFFQSSRRKALTMFS